MTKCQHHNISLINTGCPLRAASMMKDRDGAMVFSDEDIAELALIERPDEVFWPVHAIWFDDPCCLCTQEERYRKVYGE